MADVTSFANQPFHRVMLNLLKRPPNARETATRLLILKYQAVHALATPPVEYLASMQEEQRQALGKEFHQITEQTCAALKSSGLWKSLGEAERQFFSTPSPLLPPQHLVDALWHTEAAGCLAWSLGIVSELPPYDVQFMPEMLQLIPGPEVSPFRNSAALRPRNELERARNVAELWHWRSRTRQLDEEGYESPQGQPTLTEIASIAARQAHQAGDIPPPIAGDFPICGKAYRAADDTEWSVARSIAMERHLAFNWVCGRARRNDWAETPTDT